MAIIFGITATHIEPQEERCNKTAYFVLAIALTFIFCAFITLI